MSLLYPFAGAWRRAASLLAVALPALSLLASCAAPMAPFVPGHVAAAAPEAMVQPAPALRIEGIPPLPQRLMDELQRYTRVAGHGLVEWHPTRPEMLVAHRPPQANTTQLYLLRGPMAALEPLTDSAEPVSSGSWEPREGRYIVFARATGGDEAYQLYRLDPTTRQTTLFTEPGQRHALQGWIKGQSLAIVSSVPLDRTAQGGTRAAPTTTLWSVDPLHPTSRRKLVELQGPGWFPGAVSEDDRTVALIRYRSANESQVWLLDLASGAQRQVLPTPGESLKATHFASEFSKDGKRLLITSDRAGEFRELMSYDLAAASLTRVSSHIPWDVSGGAGSHDGRWLAAQVNHDGREELRMFDAQSFKELAAPAVPVGSIGGMDFHRVTHQLAYAMNTARGPGQIHVLDPASGRSVQWTRAHTPAGIDTSTYADQRVVRWKSFDGLQISGLYTRPPARFAGKRPVIVSIHGGPEAQAMMGFQGRWNYFVQEQGIAVIEPNVRGSSGYGKTFLALDNGVKREDSVKDIGALLDWIAQQPDLDASRVLVTGGSYGGYMTQAVSVHYSDRIVGGLTNVGISNFVSFLTHTESYRRDLRRAEYGDERDPAMRAFLEKISPLNNAEKIRKPLFVVQGKNDPRVPFTESEQIVAKVRANGLPVWYLRGENEGHGFARQENADFLFYAMVKFVEQTLSR